MTKVMPTGITEGGMKAPAPQDDGTSRLARKAGIVMAVTMILWMGLQVIGGEMGWPVRYTRLFDLAALAGFIWSLAVTYQIWRKRRG